MKEARIKSGLVLPGWLATGCTSTVYTVMRIPFSSEKAPLEAYCESMPNADAEFNELVRAAYAKGWRLAMAGHTVTTVLGIPVSSAPVICVERVH